MICRKWPGLGPGGGWHTWMENMNALEVPSFTSRACDDLWSQRVILLSSPCDHSWAFQDSLGLQTLSSSSLCKLQPLPRLVRHTSRPYVQVPPSRWDICNCNSTVSPLLDWAHAHCLCDPGRSFYCVSWHLQLVLWMQHSSIMEMFVWTWCSSSWLNLQNAKTEVSLFDGLSFHAGMRSVWEPRTWRVRVAFAKTHNASWFKIFKSLMP